MARTSSKITHIVNYFRTTPLEVAEVTLDLAKDAVRERRQKGETIKAAQKRARGKGKASRRTAAEQPASAAADAATASVGKAARRKPGPKPGTKRGRRSAGAEAGSLLEEPEGADVRNEEEVDQLTEELVGQ